MTTETKDCPYCHTRPNGGDKACERHQQVQECPWATKDEQRRAHQIEGLLRKAETGEQWAEIARLEAMWLC